MQVGDIVRTRRLSQISNDGNLTLNYLPDGKDEVFVCLLLGVEKKVCLPEETKRAAEEALNNMGWVRKGP